MSGEALERLMKMRDDPYAAARAWKERTGGKVMGYFCCYAPEEMIHAAGALPVRITGGEPRHHRQRRAPAELLLLARADQPGHGSRRHAVFPRRDRVRPHLRHH